MCSKQHTNNSKEHTSNHKRHVNSNKQHWKDKLHNNILWILFLSILLLSIGDFVLLPLFPEIEESHAFLFTFNEYFYFIGTWISVMAAILMVRRNRYILGAIGSKAQGNTIPFLLAGFAAGFILNGFSALVAGLHGDYHLDFVKFEFLPALALFFSVFVQSSAEEVLCRGFTYQRLLKSTNKPAIAIGINALFFAAIHLFNDGITPLAFYDLLITGVFFSLVVYYFDSLWMAMGIHTTWNYTQSIVLGLPNSGSSFPYSIFQLDTGHVSSSFAYDVGFGLEGTILSAGVMTACSIGLYLWKRKEKPLL